MTVEEKIAKAEKEIVDLEKKIDKATSWFMVNGCMKTLIIISSLLFLAYVIGMFLYGFQAAKNEHLTLMQIDSLAEIERIKAAADVKVSVIDNSV